jgi:hypothetical protein
VAFDLLLTNDHPSTWELRGRRVNCLRHAEAMRLFSEHVIPTLRRTEIR